jgi:hypothetical protein
MNYFVIKEDHHPTNVYVSDIPAGLTRKYQLLKGISRRQDWPDDLALQFTKNRPEGMNLTDWVGNQFGWSLVSDRFKRLLEESGAPDVEYLPVKMTNHKGRIAAEDYWIVNMLNLKEAVDRGRSVFDVDAADEDLIFSFDKLVLRDDVIASGPVIFRLKERPRLVLVRQDLAERIKQERLTGLLLVETSKFMSNDPNE